MKMNKTTSRILFGLIVIIGIVLLATKNSREGTELTVQQETEEGSNEPIFEGDELATGTYAIDPQASSLEWNARKKIIPNYVDKGTLGIIDGSITIDNEELITEASVAIDVNSLEVTETGVGGGFNGLVRDMLSGRFLDVETYPTASFIVTSVESGRGNMFELTGDLTIKGVTQSVMLPVSVDPMSATVIKITGDLEIDRTVYDVTFGSDKFFDDLGDKVIDDMVQLVISLQATLVE